MYKDNVNKNNNRKRPQAVTKLACMWACGSCLQFCEAQLMQNIHKML